MAGARPKIQPRPQSSIDAQRMLGMLGHSTTSGHLYLDGRGVARDFARAYAYYLRAAEQLHERAMNLVGRCCEEGWGTPRDLEAAARVVSALGRRRLFPWAIQLGHYLLKTRPLR